MSLFRSLFLALLVAFAPWPGLTLAQGYRDFTFEDEEGHRVLRFVGVGHGELTEDQVDEVSNAEFSTMVHDRIRADLRFEAEPVDPEWFARAERQIREHLLQLGPEFVAPAAVECRSASCRIVLEHSGSWTVAEHRSLLADVQRLLEDFVASSNTAFEPVFLITAYSQQSEAPHITAFLQRAR